MIFLENISARFPDHTGSEIDALRSVSMQFEPGRFYAIVGPSGSGKTTLINIIAGILLPTEGTIRVNGVELAPMGERQRDNWRRQACGLIFQDFRLIEELSPLHNVLLPALFTRFRAEPAQRVRAMALLDHFDVPRRAGPVATLSRGQQQRVAMARALLLSPSIILADEPTASLDRVNAERIVDELASLAGEGKTVICVSHDERVSRRADHVFELMDGCHVVKDGEQTSSIHEPESERALS
jgi:ABC-type lipoprotein export system ATPase subunit